VDDDATLTDVVGRYLSRDGHQVVCVPDGYAALRRVAEDPPDLVVLDLMLPGMSGLEVCRRLREHWPIPVVMLTALGEETDKLAGFETGADDYVTKPFSPRELAMRVRSVLRRARGNGLQGAPSLGVLRDGGLAVDLSAHEVRLGAALVALTSREYDLLVFLLRHPRQAFTREELLAGVWNWTSNARSWAGSRQRVLMPLTSWFSHRLRRASSSKPWALSRRCTSQVPSV